MDRFTAPRKFPPLDQLRERIRTLERRPAGPVAERGEVVPTGIPPLDRLLPEGGCRRGTLVEWLGEAGSGALQWALLAVRDAWRNGGTLVVVDGERSFDPPGWAALGLDPRRIVVVRPANGPDRWWAWEQCLRCRGVAVVVGALLELDDRVGRRLQLAAEVGGTIGLIQRPLRAQREPCWADLRLEVVPQPGTSPHGRRGRIVVLRSRAGGTASSGLWDFGEQDHAERHDVRRPPAAVRSPAAGTACVASPDRLRPLPALAAATAGVATAGTDAGAARAAWVRSAGGGRRRLFAAGGDGRSDGRNAAGGSPDAAGAAADRPGGVRR